jgi:hypothetical protein
VRQPPPNRPAWWRVTYLHARTARPGRLSGELLANPLFTLAAALAPGSCVGQTTQPRQMLEAKWSLRCLRYPLVVTTCTAKRQLSDPESYHSLAVNVETLGGSGFGVLGTNTGGGEGVTGTTSGAAAAVRLSHVTRLVEARRWCWLKSGCGPRDPWWRLLSRGVSWLSDTGTAMAVVRPRPGQSPHGGGRYSASRPRLHVTHCPRKTQHLSCPA